MPLTSSQRIPSALARLVRIPDRDSLVLLTGVQDAGSTWLLLRYLGACLDGTGLADLGGGETAVVLVSWMRDVEFWRAETKRTMGIDLARTRGRFAFVDGSSTRYLAELEQTVNKAVETLDKVILLLDTPSAMLFLQSADACDLLALLMRLRSLPQVHAVVAMLPADAPLLAASPHSAFNGHGDTGDAGLTWLDTESAAFTVGAAYQADLVLACRPLATGWAEDVSGVVRATVGGNGVVDSAHTNKEWLYLAERDGSVRVWERGGV